MIDLANSIKSNFDMGLFDENLNKVDAQTLEYLREEVSQTEIPGLNRKSHLGQGPEDDRCPSQNMVPKQENKMEVS